MNGIEQTTGYYLQILDSPYQEWKTLLVPSATWDESLEYEGFQYQPWEIVTAVGNEVYCIVRKIDDNGNPILCLGKIRLSEEEEAAEDIGQQTAESDSRDSGKEAQKVPDGTLLGEVPRELKDGRLFLTKAGAWYGYQESGTKIWTLDETLQIQDARLADGRVLGLLEDAAGNGYLLALDELFADGGELWTAAVESGKIGGIQYGVPYAAQLYFPTFSGTLTDGRSGWTLEEFMEAVRKSDAEILQYGFGGTEIVVNYGLYDNENTELIDWERGESHLTEPLFLSLLGFAAEYADTGKIPQGEVGEALESGRIAAEGSFLIELSELNYREACFAGNPADIGFPRSSGNGIYLTPNMLYVNANSAVPEGAKAFLRFLISEESQLRYVGRSVSGAALLPVREDALEKLLTREEMQSGEEIMAHSSTGVSYAKTGLSEENQARFWELVEKAEPGNWYAAEILDLIYEELDPYFAGQRSAEEAAKNLDNRVQLYLDERK